MKKSAGKNMVFPFRKNEIIGAQNTGAQGRAQRAGRAFCLAQNATAGAPIERAWAQRQRARASAGGA